MNWLTVIFIVAIPFCAFGSGDDYIGSADDFENSQEMLAIMKEALTAVKDLDPISALNNCNKEIAANKLPDRKCIEKYAKLYSKPVVDMRIVLGYMDSQEGTTSDILIREAIVAQLLSDCPPNSKNVHMCGFVKSDDDADKFSKEVVGMFGKKHIVNFTVVNSSYTNDEKINLAKKNRQKEQSEKAKKVFLDGLKNADAIFYSGHSRDGGGPDFSPPILKKNGHVNYAWYQKNKPGVREMIAALEERKKEKGTKDAPGLIGLLSCFSAKHFKAALQKASPNTGMILSKNYAFEVDDPYTMTGIFNGLLGQVCEPDFSKGINDNPKIDPSSKMYNYNFLK